MMRLTGVILIKGGETHEIFWKNPFSVQDK